jgi:hypothetical protein
MSKVLINGIIKTDEETIDFEVKGILDTNNNVLMYNFDEVKNSLYLNENILKRESLDNIITLNFNKDESNKSSILLKDTKFEISLKLTTLYIDKSNNEYKVGYLLEDRKKIEYEIKYKFM